jgi:hypothetical protein
MSSNLPDRFVLAESKLHKHGVLGLGGLEGAHRWEGFVAVADRWLDCGRFFLWVCDLRVR